MTDPPQQQPDSADGTQWTRQFLVAVGLLFAFAVLVVAMMLLAEGEEIVWQRRVYLFGAVEAVVFTAIGWLFGREVHRSAAESAKGEATQAREDAAAARDEASRLAADVVDAQRTAAEEKAKGQAVRAVIDSTTVAPGGAGPIDVREGAPRSGTTVVDLKKLADRLYGESP